MIVCVHSSLIPLQHCPMHRVLLWAGGSVGSRGPTCLLPLSCPGAALAPAAGLGAGIQTDQGQEPGKEGGGKGTAFSLLSFRKPHIMFAPIVVCRRLRVVCGWEENLLTLRCVPMC